MDEKQMKEIGWEKSRSLLHLVMSVREDAVGLPILEDKYGDTKSLFGWVTSKESHMPLNIWTKRFKDWFENSTGDFLIDYDLASAIAEVANETGSVAGQPDEKKTILKSLEKLQKIADLLKSTYQFDVEKLADKISSASASKEESCKGDYHERIAELSDSVLKDLKEYEGEDL